MGVLLVPTTGNGCFPLCQTDQSEISGNTCSEENGTIFSDYTGPTNRNRSCHFKLFFWIPKSGQRTGSPKMEQWISVRIFQLKQLCGPPSKVIPNIPVRRNRNGPFHLNFHWNFWNLWYNGKYPSSPITKRTHQACSGITDATSYGPYSDSPY